MYRKKPFKHVLYENHNSPQRQIFNQFYSKPPNSKSEFGSRPRLLAQSELSYIKLRVIGDPANKDQQNDELRQTMNSVQNYEKAYKYNRYEFRPPNAKEESPYIDQGSPPVVQYQEINRSIERKQINNQFNNNQLLRMNNPLTQSQNEQNFQSNFGNYQPKNFKGPASLKSEPVNRDRLIQQFQQQIDKSSNKDSVTQGIRDGGRDTVQSNLKFEESKTSPQKFLEFQSTNDFHQRQGLQIQGVINQRDSQKYEMQRMTNNSRMKYDELYIQGPVQTQSDLKVPQLYVEMVNDLRRDDIRKTMDQLRMSVRPEDRYVKQETQSELDKSGSIMYKDLKIELNQTNNQDEDLHKFNSGVQFQSSTVFKVPSIIVDPTLNVVEEIAKLKVLMERHEEFQNQVIQIEIIMERYDHTQKPYMLLYFQELFNLVQGVDNAVDTQLHILLQLIQAAQQKERLSYQLNNNQENRSRDRQRDTQMSHPQLLYKQDDMDNMENVDGGNDSDILDESPTDKNDVASIQINQSYAKIRPSEYSQIMDQSQNRISHHNGEEPPEIQFQQKQSKPAVQQMIHNQQTFGQKEIQQPVWNNPKPHQQQQYLQTNQYQQQNFQNQRLTNQSNHQQNVSNEEMKQSQRKTINQAEEQIQQKLSKAQNNLDKKLEERKREQQKEQVQHFYQLCMEVRDTPEFRYNNYASMVKIPELYQKCKEKKILQEHFREFIRTEYLKHINRMASVEQQYNSQSNDSDSPQKDRGSFAHREKNIFLNRKRKETPIRGTHMVISSNQIGVIDENEEEVEYSEDDGTGKRAKKKVVLMNSQKLKKIKSDDVEQIDANKRKVVQQEQGGVKQIRQQR